MFGGTRKENYEQIIDAEDEEAGTAAPPMQHSVAVGEDMHGGSAPPMNHEAVHVSFEGISAEKEKLMNSSREKHRWDHIEDIDQFFTLCYDYYQGSGFLCIALRNGFALFQFIFVVCFSTFLLQCVDYGVLFNDKNTTTTGQRITGKRHIGDAIDGQCLSHMHPFLAFSLLMAAVFWVAHLIRVGYRLLQHYEIRTFFETVLEIPDYELCNFTWREVVVRICKVQPQLHLIINQEEITPLDVYQRILRYKNYMIAMVYNNILPPSVRVPFVGSVPYLSSGLRLNLEWMLFWGPWSPWKSSYSMKEEYRTGESLDVLAERMRRTVLWMGIANLVFFPFVFLYQVLFSFFSYADLIKREPDVFGTRKYSNYGRLKLRHFNELDHELRIRLSRSYEYAVRYMDQFISPTAEIIAKTVAFTAGSIFAVLAILSAWDEDVLNIEHVLTAMTVCGSAVLICRSFIPKENMVFCQDFLMRQIVANIHYAPETWLREAHSSEVCKEFGQLFQLKAHYLLEELLSPLLTPMVLLFSVAPKASAIVQFLHDHTESIDGLGDVCSYSLMDVKKDGDLRLSELNKSVTEEGGQLGHFTRKVTSAGKVELSLLNFATLNPDWRPPAEAADLINTVKDKISRDAADNPHAHAVMCESLRDLERSMMVPTNMPPLSMTASMAARSRPSAAAAQQPEYAGLDPLESTSADAPPSSFSAAKQPTAQGGKRPSRSDGARGSLAEVDENEEEPAAMAASTTALYQPSNFQQFVPRNIRERNVQAIEMSMNALLVNRMLMSNGALQQRRTSTYGATAIHPAAQQSRYPGVEQSRFGAFGRSAAFGGGSAAASNIWGVPEQSQLYHERPGASMYGSDSDPLGL